MKKIIISTSVALVACALLSGIVLAETQTNGTQPAPTASQTSMLSCVATAVAKRESAIQSAFSTFSTSITAALQTRASELASAWSMSDKTARNKAIQDAWKKFSDSKKAARTTYNSAMRTAWNEFATDRKACKAPATGESQSTDSL